MNYYLDCEFLEGTQTKRILGIPYGTTNPTIDLISLALVAEDGREYYELSKDFNLKEAWNRFEWKPDIDNGGMKKVYWIRENVLRPIWEDLQGRWNAEDLFFNEHPEFTYSSLKELLSIYGKSNAQIAEEMKEFCKKGIKGIDQKAPNMIWPGGQLMTAGDPIFYGYYSAYDHVALCWLFGRMIDLPSGFPMYTWDLKQELEAKIALMKKYKTTSTLTLEYLDFFSGKDIPFGEAAKIDWDKWIKQNPNYPKQTNEHHALSDARFNRDLHKFIMSL